MKQDLNEIKKILREIGVTIIRLNIREDELRDAGAPLFADKLKSLIKELDIFQLDSLKALGEDVE